jgi:hypothetical protein
MLPSFQFWLSYWTRQFLSMSTRTIPVMFLIIKKRADIHLLQVQFAEYIQIWAVPNMLQVQRMVLTNPNPGIVSIQFSTCLKLTFITKTYRLQKSFSLYFSAFFPMTWQPLLGQDLLIEASRSHSDKPHSAGLLWTSDHPDAETSTGQYKTIARNRHPCSRRDSNPQFQQASSRRPTS